MAHCIHCRVCGCYHIDGVACIKQMTAEEEKRWFENTMRELRRFEECSKQAPPIIVSNIWK